MCAAKKKNQKPWWAIALCVVLFLVSFWSQYGDDIQNFFHKGESDLASSLDLSIEDETKKATKTTEAVETTKAVQETEKQTGEVSTQAPTEAKTEAKTEAQTEAKTQAPTQAKTEASTEPLTQATLDKNGSYTSKEDVALYLHLYGKLPSNFIKKNAAEKLGWESSKGNLWDVAPGKSIGGDSFGNYEGNLPKAKGRKYYECDIDYDGGYRSSKRIVYSNDGLVYYTEDHYETFELLYEK